jgi:hypothetical protein
MHLLLLKKANKLEMKNKKLLKSKTFKIKKELSQREYILLMQYLVSICQFALKDIISKSKLRK